MDNEDFFAQIEAAAQSIAAADESEIISEAINRQRFSLEMHIEYWRIEDEIRSYFESLIRNAKTADDFTIIKAKMFQYEPIPDDTIKRFKHYQKKQWSNL